MPRPPPGRGHGRPHRHPRLSSSRPQGRRTTGHPKDRPKAPHDSSTRLTLRPETASDSAPRRALLRNVVPGARFRPELLPHPEKWILSFCLGHRVAPSPVAILAMSRRQRRWVASYISTVDERFGGEGVGTPQRRRRSCLLPRFTGTSSAGHRNRDIRRISSDAWAGRDAKRSGRRRVSGTAATAADSPEVRPGAVSRTLALRRDPQSGVKLRAWGRKELVSPWRRRGRRAAPQRQTAGPPASAPDAASTARRTPGKGNLLHCVCFLFFLA